MNDGRAGTAAVVRVGVGDRSVRRRAALVAAHAYGRGLVGVGFGLGVAGFALVVGVLPAWQDSTPGGRAALVAVPVVGFGLMLAAWTLTCAACVYFAPRMPGHELWFVDTGRARAALMTASDRRRGALEGDVKAALFAAWPQRCGAGRILGEYVQAEVEGRGSSRVTLAAMPAMARVYGAHGFVLDGPQLGLLPVRRMASRPRPPEA